ncbi:hypothetical protein C8Q75DRAFT_761536 [Abortiporus biennis]|nr:hypothetical protein C8Q75DRAFT_761536 [Abortiporus biennis]
MAPNPLVDSPQTTSTDYTFLSESSSGPGDIVLNPPSESPIISIPDATSRTSLLETPTGLFLVVLSFLLILIIGTCIVLFRIHFRSPANPNRRKLIRTQGNGAMTEKYNGSFGDARNYKHTRGPKVLYLPHLVQMEGKGKASISRSDSDSHSVTSSTRTEGSLFNHIKSKLSLCSLRSITSPLGEGKPAKYNDVTVPTIVLSTCPSPTLPPPTYQGFALGYATDDQPEHFGSRRDSLRVPSGGYTNPRPAPSAPIPQPPRRSSLLSLDQTVQPRIVIPDLSVEEATIGGGQRDSVSFATYAKSCEEPLKPEPVPAPRFVPTNGQSGLKIVLEDKEEFSYNQIQAHLPRTTKPKRCSRQKKENSFEDTRNENAARRQSCYGIQDGPARTPFGSVSNLI